MKRFAFVTLLVACGGEATVVEVPPQQMPPPQPQATVQVQVQTLPQVAPAGPGMINAGENWIGRYRCAQGTTEVDLRIDAVNGSQIDATFIFAHGPSGAAGSYKMRGTLGPDGSLTLAPGEWVARPPNYVSVGMSGNIHGKTYSGRIDNASCGAFNVQRSAEQ
jgi:hypothetical protein